MTSPAEFDTVTARFEVIRAESGRTQDALVPRSIMRGIAAGISRAPTLKRTNPLKSRQQRNLWGQLADEATARPEHVGFVLLGDGGLREFAERLGVRPATLTKCLTGWSRTRPRMLQAYHGRKLKGVAPLLAVQIPAATGLVLWAAVTRSTLDAGDGRFPHPLLVADAVERLAMLGTTGPAYETWPLLDDAVEDLGATIARKGGEPPRRRLETGRKR